MTTKLLSPSHFKPCYLHEVNMIEKILEKFEENPIVLLSEKLFSLVVKVFGLSTNGDLRSRVRLCVHSSHFFSETAHHIFLKFYMKLGFKKVWKNFPSPF